MGLSDRFYKNSQEVITSRFDTNVQRLTDISDKSLDNLIRGTERAIKDKNLFIETHNFPENDSRQHKEKMQNHIAQLTRRLGVLSDEKARRK